MFWGWMDSIWRWIQFGAKKIGRVRMSPEFLSGAPRGYGTKQ